MSGVFSSDPSGRKFPSDQFKSKLQEFSKSQFGKVTILHGDTLKKVYLHEIIGIVIKHLINNPPTSPSGNHPPLNLKIDRKIVNGAMLDFLQKELAGLDAIKQEDRTLITDFYDRFNDSPSSLEGQDNAKYKDLTEMMEKIKKDQSSTQIYLKSTQKTSAFAGQILPSEITFKKTPGDTPGSEIKPVTPLSSQQIEGKEPLKGAPSPDPPSDKNSTPEEPFKSAFYTNHLEQVRSAINAKDPKKVFEVASQAIKAGQDLDAPLSLLISQNADKKREIKHTFEQAITFFIKHNHAKEAADLLILFFQETEIIDHYSMNRWLSPIITEVLENKESTENQEPNSRTHLVDLIVELVSRSPSNKKSAIARLIFSNSWQLSLSSELAKRLDLYTISTTIASEDSKTNASEEKNIYTGLLIWSIVSELKVEDLPLFEKFITKFEEDRSTFTFRTMPRLIGSSLTRLKELKETAPEGNQEAIKDLIKRLEEAMKKKCPPSDNG